MSSAINENTELSVLEAEAIDSYIENIYAKKHLEPKAPSNQQLSFWNIAGIEAVLYTIAGIGIVIYSSIRTGGMFYIMEMLLLKKYELPTAIQESFSFTAMVASLAAFELFVLVDGFSKGKNNKGLTRSKSGLIASIAVIVGAGIFTGLGLISDIDETVQLVFYTTLALGTAVAGGVVALASGENIGYTFYTVNKVRSKIINAYAKAHTKWRESGVKSYLASHYAIGTDKAEDFKKKVASSKKKDKPSFDDEYVNVLRGSIVKFLSKSGRIPTIEELVEIGVSKSYAKKALKKYAEGDAKTNGQL